MRNTPKTDAIHGSELQTYDAVIVYKGWSNTFASMLYCSCVVFYPLSHVFALPFMIILCFCSVAVSHHVSCKGLACDVYIIRWLTTVPALVPDIELHVRSFIRFPLLAFAIL